MKRFQVRVLCRVLIDVGTIEAASFAGAEEAARRLVAEKYPSGRARVGCTWCSGKAIPETEIVAVVTDREEPGRRQAS